MYYKWMVPKPMTYCPRQRRAVRRGTITDAAAARSAAVADAAQRAAVIAARGGPRRAVRVCPLNAIDMGGVDDDTMTLVATGDGLVHSAVDAFSSLNTPISSR